MSASVETSCRPADIKSQCRPGSGGVANAIAIMAQRPIASPSLNRSWYYSCVFLHRRPSVMQLLWQVTTITCTLFSAITISTLLPPLCLGSATTALPSGVSSVPKPPPAPHICRCQSPSTASHWVGTRTTITHSLPDEKDYIDM